MSDSAEFVRGVEDGLRRAVYEGLLRIRSPLERACRDAVGAALYASEEATSLLAGDLRSQFGIADPGPAVEAILGAVKASVHAEVFRGTGGDDLGRITITALRADLSDVLGLKEGSYISHSIDRNTDTVIPWLYWLLMQGDALVVTDFEINTEKKRHQSRTERAIMIKTTRRQARGFHVPSNFSGVVDANWLTRVMTASVPGVFAAVTSAVRGM